MCPPGCPVSSLCFSYFPVIKTVVENRSFFFPRALATFHTLCALLGRRIQCFGVCHSDIKLFLLVAPAWRCSSASLVATLGKRRRLVSGATCRGGPHPCRVLTHLGSLEGYYFAFPNEDGSFKSKNTFKVCLQVNFLRTSKELTF